MFLLRKIPNTKIIISSEYCNKSGVFKKLNTNKTPNIGLLRIPKGDKMLHQSIFKCLHVVIPTDKKFMEIFKNTITKFNYDKYVCEPNVYCPINWTNFKELYNEKIDNENYKFISKYSQHTDTFKNILKTSIGIHLWNTLYVKHNLHICGLSKILSDSVDDIVIDNYDIKICIPTYERVKTICDKTLKFLDKHFISREKTYIFVEDKKQYNLYYQHLDKKYNIIITNTNGIGEKRNFIRNYFKNGTKIIMIDDDLDDVVQFINKKSSKSMDDFKSFTIEAFKECERHSVSMFGVCIFDNPFYSTGKFSTNLKFIGGGLHGVLINDISRNIKTSIDHFDDVEYSIKHYIKEGKTLRYNNVGLRIKYYSKEGGIAAHKGGLEKREEEALYNATYLTGVYPDLCSITTKKDGRINIKLKDRLQKFTVDFD